MLMGISTDSSTINRYAMLLVRWKNASRFTTSGRSLLRMVGSSFFAVWMEPLAQRCCWLLKAFMSTGTSAGEMTSGRNTNCQPFNWAR